MHLPKPPHRCKEPSRLERIESKLDDLLRRVELMAEGQKELDAALATLGEDVAKIKTAVEALIAAIPPSVDLTVEVAAVREAFGSIESTTAEAEGAIPPTSPPE